MGLKVVVLTIAFGWCFPVQAASVQNSAQPQVSKQLYGHDIHITHSAAYIIETDSLGDVTAITTSNFDPSSYTTVTTLLDIATSEPLVLLHIASSSPSFATITMPAISNLNLISTVSNLVPAVSNIIPTVSNLIPSPTVPNPLLSSTVSNLTPPSTTLNPVSSSSTSSSTNSSPLSKSSQLGFGIAILTGILLLIVLIAYLTYYFLRIRSRKRKSLNSPYSIDSNPYWAVRPQSSVRELGEQLQIPELDSP
ncbi:hypothetical protein MMC14_006519 [Varicellaria rhodocarpa]|nr:hypothetical protein [Varicellaria rhodocarpa]